MEESAFAQLNSAVGWDFARKSKGTMCFPLPHYQVIEDMIEYEDDFAGILITQQLEADLECSDDF